MRFYKEDNFKKANGTSLRGHVTATLADLIETFGEPMRTSFGDDKTTVEWVLVFENEDEADTVATIYDWKNEGTPKFHEVFEWNIGGKDYDAVIKVHDALALSKKSMMTV